MKKERAMPGRVEQIVKCVSDKSSGDYFDKSRMGYSCIAIVDNKPIEIGFYCASLPKEQRQEASRRIWKLFLVI